MPVKLSGVMATESPSMCLSAGSAGKFSAPGFPASDHPVGIFGVRRFLKAISRNVLHGSAGLGGLPGPKFLLQHPAVKPDCRAVGRGFTDQLLLGGHQPLPDAASVGPQKFRIVIESEQGD